MSARVLISGTYAFKASQTCAERILREYRHLPSATDPLQLFRGTIPPPVVLLQPEENEEEHNMSALFEYFSLFDFFIVAALVGIFCCGLLDGETT
jgi:hypothetical protein